MSDLILLGRRRGPFGMRKQKPVPRDKQIVARRKEGKTLMEIGEEFGLSHVRVMQILKKEEKDVQMS